jgi:hypothetical protein
VDYMAERHRAVAVHPRCNPITTIMPMVAATVTDSQDGCPTTPSRTSHPSAPPMAPPRRRCHHARSRRRQSPTQR